MIEHLMQRHNYINTDLVFLKNTIIREFDMVDAGFSIIKSEELFDEDLICKLEKLEKQKRHIAVGKIIKRNPDVGVWMLEAFKDIRRDFALSNNLDTENILSIKKDALFIIGKNASNLQIGNYTFQLKNSYTSYYYINGVEFYLNSKENLLHIKGLNKEVSKIQQDKFLEFFKNILLSLEIMTDKEKIINYLRQVQSDYLEGNLDIECYREMRVNPLCMFKLTNELGLKSFDIYTEDFNDYFDNLDVSYNYMNYLLPLIQISIA